MQRICVLILIATLCCSVMVFASCDEVVFTAEEMMTYCNDSIVLDPLNGVNEIALSADLYAVAFYNVPGDKVTIDFTKHDKASVKAQVKNSTLYIVQESQPFTVYVGGTLCLVVGIPESWTNYILGAHLDVGTLSIENSKASNVQVDMGTGAAKVSVVDATSVTIQSDTGAVNFQGKTDILTADAATGNIKLEGQATTVTATTDTGAIKVNMNVGFLQVHSDAGSIDFDVKGSPFTIIVKSNTGFVKGKIEGTKEWYEISVDVSTGHCNLKDQLGAGLHFLHIEIDTGSAKIDFV